MRPIIFLSLLLILFSSFAFAQNIDDEYIPPEYEDEVLTEDMYYQTERRASDDFQLQEEPFSNQEQNEWNAGELPEEDFSLEE